MRHSRIAAFVLAGLFASVVSVEAATFDSDIQKCRSAVAKSVAKHTKTVGKVLASCHKARNDRKLAGAIDCNAINETTDPKGQTEKSRSKFRSAIGGDKDKCDAITPSASDYHFCPANCLTEVGAIASFSDVADCLICLIEDQVTGAGSDNLGRPTTPQTKGVQKCNAEFAKGGAKHMDTVLKSRIKCQAGAEKSGAMSTTESGCASAPDAKIDGSRSKADEKILDRCASISVASVDSCSAVSMTAAADCTLDRLTAEAGSLFERAYALGNTDPTTTTSTSTTTTTTTTTTTLEASWEAIQPLFATRCSSCHTGAASGSGGLFGLSDFDNGYNQLVNAASTGSALVRVDPCDSTASYVMHKLEGTHIGAPAFGSGQRMPRNCESQGNCFDQITLDQIRLWITSGARKLKTDPDPCP